MADLTLQTITSAGISPSLAAASAGGDRIPAMDRTFFHVKNGGGSSINVTFDSIRPCDQGFDHDLVVAVPAGTEKKIALVDTSRFSSAGWVNVSYSAVTSVTVGVFLSK